MISFTIDTSVFALPPKNNNQEIEYKNIQRFITNMYYLQYLEKCPSVTVSYMNHIPKNLVIYRINPNDITYRIKEIKKYAPLINNNPDILDFFNEKYREIIQRPYKEQMTEKTIFRKGKIGIYENIPGKDTDPEIKYKNISYDNSIYPDEFKKQLLSYFELYLGFIAGLNNKYFSKDCNYIVISGDLLNLNEKITLCYDQFKVSKAHIIGIQKTSKLCPNIIFNNISDVINEFEKCNNLLLGQQTVISNIEENIQFDNSANNITSKKDFSNKLYHYLNTLNDLVEIINRENIFDTGELNFLLNSHGCFCSPDSKVYEKCPMKVRHFNNNKGVDEYFTLHLKPITYNRKSEHRNLTRRIYFKLKDDKVLIGWIGEHPQSCSNEPDSECAKASCPFQPKKPLSSDNFSHYINQGA
jgi:hypothetical protein